MTVEIAESDKTILRVSKRRSLTGRKSIYAGPVYKVINTGTGAALQIELKKGESVKAKPDALVVKSENIEIESDMQGGFLESFYRGLSTSSLFFLILKASRGEDNDMLLASKNTGDIILLECQKEPMNIIRGAFLVADSTVELNTNKQTELKKVLFGPGLFVLRAEGYGTVAISSHGSMFKYTLKAGEKRSVDNGHLVAWSAHMHFEVGLATNSFYTSITSGEGMMCHFTGPGTIYIQTHQAIKYVKEVKSKD